MVREVASALDALCSALVLLEAEAERGAPVAYGAEMGAADTFGEAPGTQGSPLSPSSAPTPLVDGWASSDAALDDSGMPNLIPEAVFRERKRVVLENLFNHDPYFSGDGTERGKRNGSSHMSKAWGNTPARRTDDFVSAWTGRIEGRGGNLPPKPRGVEERAAALDECIARVADATSIDDLSFPILACPSVAPIRAEVLPLLEAGLQADRWPALDIRNFMLDMDQLLATIARDEAFASCVLRRLIAATMYGPCDRNALSVERFQTLGPEDVDEQDAVELFNENGIALTQLFGQHFSRIGTMLLLGPDDAVFLGRASDLDSYVARLEDLERACGDVYADAAACLARRRCGVFRMSDDSVLVSTWHGVVYHDGEKWVYLDLQSTNGTRLTSAIDVSDVRDAMLCKLAPGDTLLLGSREPLKGSLAYCEAASLVVSAYAPAGATATWSE